MKTRFMVAGLCILLSVFLPDTGGYANAQTVQQSQSTLTVNLGNRYRPVTHAASGSLYGLADKHTPLLNQIEPLKPSTFVQMAPDGQQLPNGEITPAGDALKVAKLAERAGAKVTIRMPDIYPNFPYRWVSWNDWLNKVDTMINKTLTSRVKNIYGYELWNEPDGTWDTSSAGSFNEGWKKTYDEVRKLDSKTPIIGPSISSYKETFMRSFLTYAKANHCLPDIISWHQWDARSLKADIQNLKQIEKDLGIRQIPISINEYGATQEEAIPGAMIQYIAQFERNGVESANMAFWYQYGRLSNLLTDGRKINGGWWLYKWYGDMKGQMVMTRASQTTSNLDGIANLDAKNRVASVVFGGAGGKNRITVKGFSSTRAFKKNVHIQVKATPWYGVDTAVQKPMTLFTGTFKIVNGKITIPIKDMHASWGYEAVITPTNKKIQGTSEIHYPPKSRQFTLREEAEDATVSNGKIYSGSYASGGAYVGSLDAQGSFVQFNVSVPRSGDYTMQIGYANGTADNSEDQLLINQNSIQKVTFPPTGGWIHAVPNSGTRKTRELNVHLQAGENTITLQKSVNYAEIDYIRLSK
ncbi:hypothetical protein NIE88_17110 [Sporolactobacillus shoreicorticis]|uniref:CBM35 domain-containing protein n=1 Tax=Sporolactobacillus shoreicorticis TaxID=1923877 RepID=A0ABW5S065_9BACL|nr:CBM35 domain-containing protein [Sporolactobacillus shoreicorticis]MCO7127480.1 hypothetical protein [Sporolactobacillus shoreicorticis]